MHALATQSAGTPLPRGLQRPASHAPHLLCPPAARRLHRTFPETQYLYDCPVPILKSWQVDEMAGASWSPYRLTFEPCRLAPFFHTSVHSYVFGAVAE